MLEVAPGVHWIRMSMPVPPGHINLWALEDGDGWTLVDTGFHCDEIRDAWLALQDNALAGKPVRRIILTHHHLDHSGLAQWLTERFQCPIWMSQAEYLACKLERAEAGRPIREEFLDFYRQAGIPDNVLEGFRHSSGEGRTAFDFSSRFQRIQEGDIISIGTHEWRVLIGSGHSPEHVCLFCDELELFISGDQLLPKILSNVSLRPEAPDADPLQAWMDSLKRLGNDVGVKTLILPSHGLPFRGASRRVLDMLAIHDDCLARIQERIAAPRRAIDLLEIIYGRLPEDRFLTFSVGTVLAHLNTLIFSGKAQRFIGSDGVALYQAK
jgi:glyoxylase-like metal-dependent hydrolase (beta-lactamase superfamily II)